MNEKLHSIRAAQLDLKTVNDILTQDKKLQLSDDCRKRIKACRTYLDQKLSSGSEVIYGVNTGFGYLCNTSIDQKDIETLQSNLIMSHACGTGNEVPQDLVKLILLLKIQGLSYGYSGVDIATVERLLFFYNNGIYPVIYQQGSLGASGDLAPLAHFSLPLIGLGEVNYKGKKYPTAEVYRQLNIEPLKLMAKEGLALLNGTQLMSAYGIHCTLKAIRLADLADITGAVSLDAFDGKICPFEEIIHQIRPHKGQVEVAANFRRILKDSELMKRTKAYVQDPYSFRCIPQVHGASRDVFNYVSSVFLTEINAVTDNPTIFPEQDTIISAGNFHGQPLAMSLDFLAIALAELGSISERRTYQLISGQRNLPLFLASNAGLNSGFMILQYTAASLVSQNKQLCTPASVDSIVSSNGQEDHVSMGANAALKCFQVLHNLERILGIELMNASQALTFRAPLRSGSFIEDFLEPYRAKIPFVTHDQVMHPLMEESIRFVKEVQFKIHEEC